MGKRSHSAFTKARALHTNFTTHLNTLTQLPLFIFLKCTHILPRLLAQYSCKSTTVNSCIGQLQRLEQMEADRTDTRSRIRFLLQTLQSSLTIIESDCRCTVSKVLQPSKIPSIPIQIERVNIQLGLISAGLQHLSHSTVSFAF